MEYEPWAGSLAPRTRLLLSRQICTAIGTLFVSLVHPVIPPKAVTRTFELILYGSSALCHCREVHCYTFSTTPDMLSCTEQLPGIVPLGTPLGIQFMCCDARYTVASHTQINWTPSALPPEGECSCRCALLLTSLGNRTVVKKIKTAKVFRTVSRLLGRRNSEQKHRQMPLRASEYGESPLLHPRKAWNQARSR